MPKTWPAARTESRVAAWYSAARCVRTSAPKVTSNPADVEGVALLPSDLTAALEAFESSDAAPRVLGDDIVQAVFAVRRWELDHYGETPPEELPERFRFAWSI